MTKAEVIEVLRQKHEDLYRWLEDHPDEDWVKGPEGKWTSGEHVVHLIQSTRALNSALWLPKFFLRYQFGTNNRSNRTYDEVVKKYQDKLAGHPGVVANISKKMPPITLENKTTFTANLEKEKMKLISRFQKWQEKDLDTYLLPHPLLGRMTIREIIMWTAYHTEHHCKILASSY